MKDKYFISNKKIFSLFCVLFFILGLVSVQNIFAGEEIKIKVGNKFFSMIKKNNKIFIPTEDLFKELGFDYLKINIDKDATNTNIAHKFLAITINNFKNNVIIPNDISLDCNVLEKFLLVMTNLIPFLFLLFFSILFLMCFLCEPYLTLSLPYRLAF